MPETWYELGGILALCFICATFGAMWARRSERWRNGRIRKK